MWPGSALHGIYTWENPRWEDFEYELKEELEGNEFSWLGNGFVQSQLKGATRETTWYLDEDKSHIPVENPLLAAKEKPINGQANGFRADPVAALAASA
jgi:hypothetical protein